MSDNQEVHLAVTIEYSGKRVDAERVVELVENALEHVRQENMLSEPEWEETSCDGIRVNLAGEDDEVC